MRVGLRFLICLLPGLWATSTIWAGPDFYMGEEEPDFIISEPAKKKAAPPPTAGEARPHHTLEPSPDFRIVDDEPEPGLTTTPAAAPAASSEPMPAAAAPAAAAPVWTQPSMRTEGIMNSSTARDDYRIGPNDLLLIEVFQVDELSGQERVNAGGQIVLPLIGPVTVGGLTQSEAEQLIARELARDFLQDPQVNIYIEEYTSQRVTVMGSVESPGVFPIKGPTTLLQAIAMAGGIDRLGDTEAVVVFRTEPEGVVGYVLNMEEIEEGQRRDPLVQNDDRIVVPKSGSKELVESISNTLRGFIRFVPVY